MALKAIGTNGDCKATKYIDPNRNKYWEILDFFLKGIKQISNLSLFVKENKNHFQEKQKKEIKVHIFSRLWEC